MVGVISRTKISSPPFAPATLPLQFIYLGSSLFSMYMYTQLDTYIATFSCSQTSSIVVRYPRRQHERMPSIPMCLICRFITHPWLIYCHPDDAFLSNNDYYGSEWTCHGQCESQSTRSSKLNFLFVDGPKILYSEGLNSSIRSEFEVHEDFIDSLFDNLLNRFSPTPMSSRQGLKIIMII
jgi:hypothetical protein